MSKQLVERLESIKKLTTDVYLMKIKSEYIANNAKCGQFVNIKCSNSLESILRRPISIMDKDLEKGTIDIAFQVKGKGTKQISNMQSGDYIDILGPLGKGFKVSTEYKKIAVIGGGIGIFPLYYLLKEMRGIERHTFLGFRSIKNVVFESEFNKNSEKFYLSTDDGTYGLGGFIVEKLNEVLSSENYDMVYTCGPTPLLKKVQKITAKNKTKCQLSLEQRMGCGIGACLVCACKTVEKDDWRYSHVCKDGPVFMGDEVIFDD